MYYRNFETRWKKKRAGTSNSLREDRMLPQTNKKKWRKRKREDDGGRWKKRRSFYFFVILPCKSSKQKPISFGVETHWAKAFRMGRSLRTMRSISPNIDNSAVRESLFRPRCKHPHSIPWQRIPSSDQEKQFFNFNHRIIPYLGILSERTTPSSFLPF